MFEWISNFGSWITEVIQPFIAFFQSVISGLKTLFSYFPVITSFVNYLISFIHPVFAAFIGISITIFIVYLIINR